MGSGGSGSFSFVVVAARKDLRRRLADPLALALWLGIPLLIGALLSLVAGPGGPAPRARLLVVNQDDSVLGRMLTGSSQWGEMLEVESTSLEQGRARIDAGEASALLIVPPGFGAAVFGVEPTRLELLTNPSQTILPRIIEEGLEILIEGVHYLQLLFEDSLRRIRDLDAADSLLSAEGLGEILPMLAGPLANVREAFRSPPISLRVEAPPQVEPAAPSPARGFGLLFLPGILFMSLLFVAQGMSDDLWRERELGTFRRILATPRSLVPVLAGKLLAGLAMMLAVSALGLGVAVVGFGVAAARTPAAIAWCAVAGAALYCYFLLMQLLATSARGAALLTNAVLFPLAMVGGSFFPFEAMPAWMARLGRWTPNGQALVQLKDLLTGSVDPVGLASAVAVIVGSALLAFGLVVRFLPGKLRA